MVTRLFYWLFHRHEWEDIQKQSLLYSDKTVAGLLVVQKCKECSEYRSQKIMSSANLMDHSR